MTCPTPSALANHIRYKHLVEKPFKCELCEYAGKTQHDVKAHLKVHYEEVELACTEPGCTFRCRAQQTMKKHFLKAAISKTVLVYRSAVSLILSTLRMRVEADVFTESLSDAPEHRVGVLLPPVRQAVQPWRLPHQTPHQAAPVQLAQWSLPLPVQQRRDHRGVQGRLSHIDTSLFLS